MEEHFIHMAAPAGSAEAYSFDPIFKTFPMVWPSMAAMVTSISWRLTSLGPIGQTEIALDGRVASALAPIKF